MYARLVEFSEIDLSSFNALPMKEELISFEEGDRVNSNSNIKPVGS